MLTLKGELIQQLLIVTFDKVALWKAFSAIRCGLSVAISREGGRLVYWLQLGLCMLNAFKRQSRASISGLLIHRWLLLLLLLRMLLLLLYMYTEPLQCVA